MTMRPGTLATSHRLLAPRIAYVVGTRSPAGEANLIPVSNVTSVSTDPEQVLLAIYKNWTTYDNLSVASGFTLSVPSADQREGVWKLGARYSRYDFPNRTAKLHASKVRLTDDADSFGPILSDGLGWLSCRIVQRLDAGGNHGIFIGEVVHVEFNDDVYASDGTPVVNPRPLMQVTGNLFTTAGGTSSIPFGQ
ncbi:flavin reductase family protein [Protofrankia symbiont of Coriaria ruscifolia]|uniref:flavin reductase family protein n=1 Tax=Protofrankia symbiont of Coriaria ruscifolia TaxID=1306542 RepID=UPI001041322A|nr:flavin reductase family protein [Protofrankia symbiont of Coriaria ruscifolia]